MNFPLYSTLIAAFAVIYIIIVSIGEKYDFLDNIKPANIYYTFTDMLKKERENIQGIKLKVKHRGSIHNIIINIDYDSNAIISEIQFEGDIFQRNYQIKQGGPDNYKVSLHIDMAISGSMGMISITTKGNKIHPKVAITHDKRKGGEEDTSNRVSLLDRSTRFIALCALFWIICLPFFRS
ncbi:MAG TPA: hypothetical protein PKK15_02550 [Kouleothrix sp.]|nr:hypothetical protein [Kouleothrix sp.]